MADTTIGTPVAIATPDLKIIDGQITTTSLQVAEHFGKRHDTVLRAIRNLLKELPEDHHRNFAEMVVTAEIGSGATRQDPAYRMTRDGFALLAMGFTGKEALQWKLAYLSAFNHMEAQLLAQATRPHNPAIDYDRISPAQAQDLKEIVAAIVKAGVQTYGETWARLQRKFRVNSYHELPATQHLEARAYLLAKLPKASANTTEPPAPAIDPVAALMHQRLLVSFAPDSGRMQCTVLQPNDFISNWQDMARGIASGEWLLSNAELANMLAACSQRMAKRLGQPAALAA